VQQAAHAPVGSAAVLPPLPVPRELERALRDKLGVPDYRALARVFRSELARQSPELSIEALRRLLTRRDVRNAAGLFVTMLRDDLAAREEALAAAELDEPTPGERAERGRIAEVQALQAQVHEALVRGDLDRVDALRDRLARAIGAPTQREQRAASTMRAGERSSASRPSAAPPSTDDLPPLAVLLGLVRSSVRTPAARSHASP